LIGWTVGVFFSGLLAATAVSLTLMLTLGGLGGPFWLTKLMFFGPFAVYLVLFIMFLRRQAARRTLALPSPERAATSAPAIWDAVEAWPTIPTMDATPGRWLRYRLASSTHPWVFLVIMLGAALFWNGIVSIFLVHMIDGHRQGKPEWFLTVFLIPFVLIGLVLIAVVLFAGVQLVTSLVVGAVRVEIADHSMRPGRSYEFVVEQSGRFRLGRVSLVLACTESATYTQGTDTRTENKEVTKEEVAQAEAMPREGLRGKLTVPGDAMHSFASAHNKITWTLRFKGRVGILPFESEYPVRVLPTAEGGPA
jgi:hypothetical protein